MKMRSQPVKVVMMSDTIDDFDKGKICSRSYENVWP